MPAPHPGPAGRSRKSHVPLRSTRARSAAHTAGTARNIRIATSADRMGGILRRSECVRVSSADLRPRLGASRVLPLPARILLAGNIRPGRLPRRFSRRSAGIATIHRLALVIGARNGGGLTGLRQGYGGPPSLAERGRLRTEAEATRYSVNRPGLEEREVKSVLASVVLLWATASPAAAQDGRLNVRVSWDTRRRRSLTIVLPLPAPRVWRCGRSPASLRGRRLRCRTAWRRHAPAKGTPTGSISPSRILSIRRQRHRTSTFSGRI